MPALGNTAGSTLGLSGIDATRVAVVDASGNQVTSFGGSGAVTIADGADVAEGTTTGAKVVTDANGTIQQYLRGLVTFFANALGAGTAAAAHRTTLASDDPAVATLGATTGAKVITDANGSIQQYLRGLIYLLITAGQTLVTATLAPATSGGISDYHNDTTSAAPANVKASAGQLYSVKVFNAAQAARFVKFHNTAGTPTEGAGVVYSVGVQAGIHVHVPLPYGLPFATGIGISFVTGLADTNSTRATAADLLVDVEYK